MTEKKTTWNQFWQVWNMYYNRKNYSTLLDFMYKFYNPDWNWCGDLVYDEKLKKMVEK